jgi:hypothetical protein
MVRLKPGMTVKAKLVMRGLDPRISCRWNEMPGSL